MSSRFTSKLHSERVAAQLGIWLGISFTIAFVTGLFSHFMQHPPSWLLWPSRPVNLYRFTQGLHVIGGIATIPLLLAKLWTVYPRLWQWPPFRSIGHATERGLVALLVAGSLFQVVTGVTNIAYWYVWPFVFTNAHYWTAYILVGALIIHVANEWAKVKRHALPTRVRIPPEPPADARSRRRFLTTVAAASGIAALVTVGETYKPLSRLALLAPRNPDKGPQGLPVNRSAAAAGITVNADYRLLITGSVRNQLSFTYEDLLKLPQHTVRLPIACVEGWSYDAEWTGIRLKDLMAQAGVPSDATLSVESLQRYGAYGVSEVKPPHWHDPLTLLAIKVNGETLHPDHGYPVRLIAPNRPGVMQTKWVTKVVAS
ncbi:molybdopterin-dependent oxidoreductase [Actinomadura barringtoniae]|uniref:Molybdopterin-dependent oxidoreductase n=1 Tax=Actinomadura barringtoniae TaxID=1427535 RepID=A0A939T4X3_9ACTN|nr:molybdopterin-dependent oxidoreductase [Actinomadura barringtoniae]